MRPQMRMDAYTPEAICRCMGLPSFEHDGVCTSAVEAVRLLLMPSFHPEICLTFAAGRVSVVSARSKIWDQIWHQPEFLLVSTAQAEGTVEAHALADLFAAMAPLAHPEEVPGICIDGMPAALLHWRRGCVALRAEGNASGPGKNAFSAFVSLAILTAWECIWNPYCRNALAEAGKYVGQSLPRQDEPAPKPAIGIMALGADEDRAQLLEALVKYRDGRQAST